MTQFTLVRAAAAAPTLSNVQAPVREKLDRVVSELTRTLTADSILLSELSAHVMTMKGKMFRPTLLLLSSATAEASEPRAVTMAAVVELVHLATLVHDDAVDHSEMRRGVQTINALFGEQMSVILGDFLYSTALAQLVALGDMEPLQALVDASTRMTLGEMRQLSEPDPLSFSEDDYDYLIRAKTASLISAACRVGAMCGAREHIEALSTFGEALGMTFQIADDMIDFTEAAETTGKPAGLDLREGKVTLPLIAALRTISPAARRRVEQLFAEDFPSDAAISDVVGIVAGAGGLEYARSRGQEYASRAAEALSALPDTAARESLYSSIHYALERHA